MFGLSDRYRGRSVRRVPGLDTHPPCIAHTVSPAAVTVLAYRLGETTPFGERPWFWEGHVQEALAAQLAREGWDVREAADTESKAPGIDLLVTKDHRWLAIEVKGFPNTTYDHGPKRGQPKPTQPTNQARQWSPTPCSG